MQKKISKSVTYIGVADATIDLFESQYKVPNGITYNSYIVFDEKNVVFDTVDNRKTKEWMSNLKAALDGKQPDYIIVSHMEPDHSASLGEFIKVYSNTTIVGNAKTFMLISQFFGEDIKNPLKTVKEGDVLNTGEHSFHFVMAPMVHWPEVMMIYDSKDKALYSSDAFGTFGTLDKQEDDWANQARRYYYNIVGKYGANVQSVLKKAATLDIQRIAPLHGPVLTENLDYYLGKYNQWSSYQVEEDGVFIAYASIYGNTAFVAKMLAEKLESKGIKALLCDITREDISMAAANAFRFGKMILAASSYDANVFPPMEHFLLRLRSKNYQNRKVALVENATWAPSAIKSMRAILETMKCVTICESSLTIKSTYKRENEEALIAIIKEILS